MESFHTIAMQAPKTAQVSGTVRVNVSATNEGQPIFIANIQNFNAI